MIETASEVGHTVNECDNDAHMNGLNSCLVQFPHICHDDSCKGRLVQCFQSQRCILHIITLISEEEP